MPEQPLEAWIAFGKDLRRFRRQRGATLDQLAARTGYGSSTISKYENAYRCPKRDFVDKSEKVLGTDGDLLRSWEDAKRAVHDPDWHRKVVTSEEEASEIKMWSPFLVPGPLQTRDYAHQIFRDGGPLDTAEEISRLVDLRVGRLRALQDRNSPRLLAIVSEAVIRAMIGSAAVMRAQLEHLLELDAARAARILVVPTDSSYHGGASGPFRLLSFKDRATLVEVEHASGGELLSGETVTRLTAVYGELQTWALPPVASRQVMSEALRRLA
ncbi:helix-turn-helix domain-containing protein [Nocardiopsis tropica]|uniref:Helix-turn-helix transcriptional regulator n=2 Tax=Nocardiopsis tropica TaxID=109330 RepID=A0ABV2A3B4_9ACTN